MLQKTQLSRSKALDVNLVFTAQRSYFPRLVMEFKSF